MADVEEADDVQEPPQKHSQLILGAGEATLLTIVLRHDLPIPDTATLDPPELDIAEGVEPRARGGSKDGKRKGVRFAECSPGCHCMA